MRRVYGLAVLWLLVCLAGFAHGAQVSTFTLCSARTATGVVTGVALPGGAKTFQGSMTVSSGSGSATVVIEGSIDGTWYDTLGTLTLSDTASDSVTLVAPAYFLYRCNVTAASGTGKSIKILGAGL